MFVSARHGAVITTLLQDRPHIYARRGARTWIELVVKRRAVIKLLQDAKWSHEPKTYSRRSELNLIAPLRLSIVDLNLEHRNSVFIWPSTTRA
jgi:hypothetical protein